MCNRRGREEMAIERMRRATESEDKWQSLGWDARRDVRVLARALEQERLENLVWHWMWNECGTPRRDAKRYRFLSEERAKLARYDEIWQVPPW